MNFKTSIITFVLLNLASFSIKAQLNLTETNLLKINEQQIVLSKQLDTIATYESDEERLKLNAAFVKDLVSVLKTPYSFQHNLEAITSLSILKAPNNAFKIFTWSIPLSNGTYKFYGAVQLSTKDGSLNLIPLNDATESFTNVYELTNAKKWFGARYYELVPVSAPGKTPYYILLGWKGNNLKTTKKVIEVISFKDNEIVFGKDIFQAKEANNVKNRIVFEYSKKNSMTLFFDKNVNMIVFDHLAPFDSEMLGNYEFYASDSSFDGYTINYQKLYLKEDIKLKNDASTMDDFYATPRKATTLLPRAN